MENSRLGIHVFFNWFSVIAVAVVVVVVVGRRLMWWIIATNKTRKMIWFLKEKLSLLLMKFLMAVMPRLLLVEQGALENPTSFRSFSSFFLLLSSIFYLFADMWEWEVLFDFFQGYGWWTGSDSVGCGWNASIGCG